MMNDLGCVTNIFQFGCDFHMDTEKLLEKQKAKIIIRAELYIKANNKK